MSPLDDELHDALHGRAAVIAPLADPMAGIERRARGIRRRRVAASVAGAALAISGIAVAVPSVLRDEAPSPVTSTPSPEPTLTADALDPAHPWAMRGVLSQTDFVALRDAWTARHPKSAVTVLFGQVYEPSGQFEAVFVASGDGASRYGFATINGSAVDIVVDAPLALQTTALVFALPGDEVPRLLVVASDTARDVAYSHENASFTSIARDKGIGIVGLEGDTLRDRVRVTDSAGHVAYEEPAPDFGGTGQRPDNELAWPTRGAKVETAVLVAAKDAWAEALGTTVEQLDFHLLFAGDTDSGVKYVMGQAWAPGKPAHQVSYATGGTNGPEPFLGPETQKDTPVLAFLITSLPGTSVDQLVVIPQPRTGQVLYDASGRGPFRPVTGQDHLDGVVVIDRAKDAIDDRLQLLDGNGDLDHPTFEGLVFGLLCGSVECG